RARRGARHRGRRHLRHLPRGEGRPPPRGRRRSPPERRPVRPLGGSHRAGRQGAPGLDFGAAPAQSLLEPGEHGTRPSNPESAGGRPLPLAANDFVHLPTHSEFSLLDGLGRITDLVDDAIAKGFDSLGLTDHGALYGSVAFYQAAMSKGIKPIIGVETY